MPPTCGEIASGRLSYSTVYIRSMFPWVALGPQKSDLIGYVGCSSGLQGKTPVDQISINPNVNTNMLKEQDLTQQETSHEDEEDNTRDAA